MSMTAINDVGRIETETDKIMAASQRLFRKNRFANACFWSEEDVGSALIVALASRLDLVVTPDPDKRCRQCIGRLRKSSYIVTWQCPDAHSVRIRINLIEC